MIVEYCCGIHMVADRWQWINLCFLTDINWAWGSIWCSTDLKFSPNVTEGWRFPVQVGLGPLSLVPTDDVIKYVKKLPKIPNNSKKGGVMDVWAASVVRISHLKNFDLHSPQYPFHQYQVLLLAIDNLKSVIWRAVSTRRKSKVPWKWSFEKTYR